ncbi:MAG TPA: DUF6519 domain-containing protein [Pyrinomonadaceae bacterium]
MKGDISRQTFARKNHYSSVRMQQGRVQLDADWNEQADIVAHRERTTTRDLIGCCGGPLGAAAFAVTVLPREIVVTPPDPSGVFIDPSGIFINPSGVRTTDPSGVRPVEPSGIRVIDPSGVRPTHIPRVPNKGDDFKLGAGRYYVDGILCENEQEVNYSAQPDFPDAPKFGNAPFNEDALYLLYLDVWQRHLTALDDPHIRETALGGPDTATRAKTVWQAKLWKVRGAGGVVCPEVFSRFVEAEVISNKGLLNASTAPEEAGGNPCIVPPSAGYRGLENLLYRVEIHTGGAASDVSTTAGSFSVQLSGNAANNQLTVETGHSFKVGNAVELFPAKAGSDAMAGRLYFVTNVNDQTVTLNQNVQGIEMSQQPRLRPTGATFKWSRQNGSVVTKIETISARDGAVEGKEITVQSLGPDDDLGFSDGDWVELTDDLTELRGQPGQLTQIVTADNATRTVMLRDAPTVVTSRNAKMRRWDGIGIVRTNRSESARNWITLENGLRIQFPANGSDADSKKPPLYATGDYWLIPTRTATADRESGNIEWPNTNGVPLAQPPEGIEHHYCPLALLQWTQKNGLSVAADCRTFFPPVTKLTTLHYVSGTGQEAKPELPLTAESLVELLHPLVVGVSNGGVPVKDARVVFEVVEGELNEALPEGESNFPNGRLSGDNARRISDTKIEVRTDDDGLAACKWELSPVRWNQQVVARLLGQDLKPIHLPVRFNANLSVAREVAYEAGKCERLDGIKTVQDALDKLCELIGLVNEPGIHVTDVNVGVERQVAGVGGRDLIPKPIASPKPGATMGNDFDLACDMLAGGLTIVCDREVYAGSVHQKPTCFVTLELPFPFGRSEQEAWGVSYEVGGLIGYRPIVLDAKTGGKGQLITWLPSTFTDAWLREWLPINYGRLNTGSRRPGRILARLTLKGNFIWARTDASLYLDGELFGVVAEQGNVTAARAPSGDGKRGGDLEMWFWLVNFEVTLDREELNVGEKTTGHVDISGPAPPQGLIVELFIHDSTVARLSGPIIRFVEGQTRGDFEVTSLKQGATYVVATYAGGERQANFNVIVSPPPRVEAVRVYRWQVTPGTQVLAEMNPATGMPPQLILTVPSLQTPNAIQVKFTDDTLVNLLAVTTKNFVVRAGATGAVVPGSVTTGQLPNSALWKANQILQPGDYQVTFVGDGADAITSLKGKRLDGDPKQLPSGEGHEGGNFQFTVRVQAPPPTAQATLLKVKRVALINNVTFIPEATIFERKEGGFTLDNDLGAGQRLNVIEVEFTGGPVNKDTVRKDGNFCVWRVFPNSVVALQTTGTLDWKSDSIVRWAVKTELARGDYTVALIAGASPVVTVPGVTPITATDGRQLDGEPTQLPSGDNKEGGTFFFRFKVS